MTEGPGDDAVELASTLRPPLLRLTRIIRNQRVDMSVTLTQLSALATLQTRGPIGAAELAALERVQPPSLTKVLGSLEEHGLITRCLNPQDKRQVIIQITTAGTDLLASERQSRNEWLALRLAEVSADEREQLRAIVPVLNKLADL